MSEEMVWRTCNNCKSVMMINKDTYEKDPLSHYCTYCNMNKAGVDKDHDNRK